MSTLNQNISWINKINYSNLDFKSVANEIYIHQLKHTAVFEEWNKQIQTLQPSKAFNASLEITQFNFLPIRFFKSHEIFDKNIPTPNLVFESSGTTNTINSKHFIQNKNIYEWSCFGAFDKIYGSVRNYCIIGLLPSYLEKGNSSLVYMVNKFIQISRHPNSNFYLNNFEELHKTLKELEAQKQPVLLIGVTYALLDFAEQFPLKLKRTIVMETGGMKGRKKEMLRTEVHQYLKQQFKCKQIHSEYGMTELLSQAYATANGKFICPPWMKVLVRSEDDPFEIKTSGKGILNIIDLANVHSCSFIATDDVGIVYEDGSFEVLGRLDNSDLRGCSLMYS